MFLRTQAAVLVYIVKRVYFRIHTDLELRFEASTVFFPL